MDHQVYLQGSYANSTNIRGDSDVDIVVETQNVFYHNVPLHLLQQYGIEPGAYRWPQFRAEVLQALREYYGTDSVTDGNKAIRVLGNDSRLNADVVPCAEYRHYHGIHYAEGITFWTRDGVQVVNFPKRHRENGARKNEECAMRYKPNIRVLKNARNSAGNTFPSYFLECLVYNVPVRFFEPRFAPTFRNVVDYLAAADDETLGSFCCQNEQQFLFGTELHQADLQSARQFIRALVHLWNN